MRHFGGGIQGCPCGCADDRRMVRMRCYAKVAGGGDMMAKRGEGMTRSAWKESLCDAGLLVPVGLFGRGREVAPGGAGEMSTRGTRGSSGKAAGSESTARERGGR